MCSYTDNDNYNINVKALQQLLYYFIQERNNGNNRIQNLIICNGLEWFIFDAKKMDHLFFDDPKFKRTCLGYSNNEMTDNSTSTAFKAIKELIEPKLSQIQFTYLNLGKLKSKPSQARKTHFYKILSPTHLLQLKSDESTYGLDKNFYKELLYIMGLEEVKEKNKSVIKRLNLKERQAGSLLELAIRKIESNNKLRNIEDLEVYGETEEEQKFGVALQLVIIWMNRILFLKLLEAQLYSYHKENEIYSFMDFSKVSSFDVLETLFFEVLNKKQDERNSEVKDLYSHIPYLNSSLFEESPIENITISISGLSDETFLSYLNSTILRHSHGFEKEKKELTLNYLLDFLNSYDFFTEAKEKSQSENKALIRANVLGLIFEKINGYKDGSFYTPGFITEYMCRETIRRTTVQKFNDKYDWNITEFKDLFNKIDKLDDIVSANEVINSITICDPAVGSGHFLVSALNEMILIKYELGILCDIDNKRLVNYWEVTIDDDELIFKNNDGYYFNYEVGENGHIDKSSQQLQVAIFHEKKKIIENCLFGVDINPNSVNIYRLRLWIELLKNTYYQDGLLQTLPNIDINIKCGNSLISKYNLEDKDLKFRAGDLKTLEQYKILVKTYKNPSLQNDENQKSRRDLKEAIEVTKNKFQGHWQKKSANEIKLYEANSELESLLNKSRLIHVEEEEEKDNIKIYKLNQDIEKLIKLVKNEEDIYRNSLEWRFEFPEVLDDDGNFVGFDVVIANPPYGISLSSDVKKYLKSRFEPTTGEVEIYTFFIELTMSNLLRRSGLCSFITTNTIYYLGKFKNTRKKAFLENKIISLLELEKRVFSDAPDVVPAIFILQKENPKENIVKLYKSNKTKKIYDLIDFKDFNFNSAEQIKFESKDNFVFNLTINDKQEKLLKKLSELETLKESYSVVYGIKTGDNKRFISNVKSDSLNWKKCASSAKNIRKFNINWQGDYLNVCNELAGLNKINYEQPKILVQYIRKLSMPTRLVCALDLNGEFYPLNNFSFIISENGYSLKVLLAILNSVLMNWYFSSSFIDYNIKPKYIKQLPLPKVLTNNTQITDLVNQILAAKKQNPVANTQELEDEIDHLVYKLYDLTYDEVLIVDPDTKITRANY